MSNKDAFPKIESYLQGPKDNVNNPFYKEIIGNILKRVLPKGFFQNIENLEEVTEDQREQLNGLLPIVVASPFTEAPCNVSFYLLCNLRQSASRFFNELMARWLVPGKRLNTLLTLAADFTLPDISEDVYTINELIIRVETQQDLDAIETNYPIIEMEARLGAKSAYFARRILEIKGLTLDEKTIMIQDHMASLAIRLPKIIDSDIYTEMQHVLVICKDEFKTMRTVKHLSRVIAIQYLFRKWLREMLKNQPKKRHFALKIFRARVQTEDTQEKIVLGVVVAVNFLQDKEIFEQRHLLKAIQNYIPSAEAIPHSFFANRRGSEYLCTLYLEIFKHSGKDFTTEEIETLRRELPNDLRDRIEHLMHPLFMPRNDEEIMRNILNLSSQIKFLRDAPQVFISFDQQTQSNLIFTVILVRVLKPGVPSIQELFKQSETFLEYIHDHCKLGGMLRKKYPKEATTFRVKLKNDQFMRKDHSIDLYKARQAVVMELRHILGDFRDYNGGMITKQHEVICAVRDLLKDCEKPICNDLLLENFFYSLTPVIMRTVIEPEALKKLFLMLTDALEIGVFKDDMYTLKIHTSETYVFAMITSKDSSIKEEVSRALNRLHLHSNGVANCYVKAYDSVCLGYIYRCDNQHLQAQFCHTLRTSTDAWLLKKRSFALPL